MKPRTPGSFEAAIMRIVGNVTDETAALAVGKSPSLVRKWADPDCDTLPDLRQSLALDACYVEAGCGPAPILAVLVSRLAAVSGPRHSPADPLERLADTLREVSEAADVWRAMHRPHLSANDAALIDKELCEAIDALEAMRRDVQAKPSGPQAVRDVS